MAMTTGGSSRAEHSAIQPGDGGSNPTPPLKLKPKKLWFALCAYHDVKQFIEQHHYTHSLNGVTATHCFCVTHGGRLVGAMVYGRMATTAWKKFGKKESEVLELRRLVFLDEVGKNSESRFIAWTLRWMKKNEPGIEVIVSYADPAHGHEGGIYRASNFEYQGLSGRDVAYLDPETGKRHHSRSLRVRTRRGGEYKPFVKRLRRKQALGLLVKVELPRKHRYVYRLK